MSEIKDASTSAEHAETLQSKEGEPHPAPTPVIKRRRWPIVLTAGTLLVLAAGGIGVIWYISAVFADITARMTFVVGSAINLFIFLAIVVQACIYWGQRSTMNEQAKVMREGLEETRSMLRQNEWAFRENQRHASATHTQMREQSEAMKGQLKTMRDSLTQNQEAMEKNWQFATAQGIATCEQIIAMRNQTLTMQGQLAAMNRQEGHLLTQATAAKDAAEMAKGQLVIMQRQLADTKEAFYTGERAYMGIVALEIGKLVPGEWITLAITWQNGGKTPAWNFRCLPDLILSEDEPKDPGYFTDDDFSDISGSFWPAQTVRRIEYPEATLKITSDLTEELWRGQPRRLWATVRAVYRDISGDVQFFYNSALFVVDPMAPTKGHFIETFQYVDFVSEQEKAEAEQNKRENPN